MKLGYFVKCPHPEIIEALAIAGADFAVVDMEHTPLGPRDLYPLVLAAEARQFKLIVRIPANEEHYFKWCLDLGINTIQVPHIENKKDIEKACDAAYFHPKGSRGLCRFVRAANFSSLDKNNYMSAENHSNKIIFQIEGDIDISSVIHYTGAYKASVLIGPYDLSQAMGKPGEIWDEVVVHKIEEIISECKAGGVKVGIFTDTVDGVMFWKERKIDFIEYGSDLQLLIGAVRNLSFSPLLQGQTKRDPRRS